MSRAFDLEYGAAGIRVNSVLPSLIRTRLADTYDAETQARVIAKSPAGRLGTPEDVGLAVLFLSSPARGFITGARLARGRRLHYHGVLIAQGPISLSSGRMDANRVSHVALDSKPPLAGL